VSERAAPGKVAAAGPDLHLGGRRLLRLLWLGLLAALLLWTGRNAPFADIWALLGQLHAWQIVALLAFNTLIIFLMTARWWIILRAEKGRVPFFRLSSYRLAAFGLSYFTLGPQVGGEPLQVICLQKNHGLTYARATATVIMDKLLEFIANFVFLAGGVFAVARAGILSKNGIPVTGSLVPLAAMLAVPLLYAGLLYGRYFPLGMGLRRLLPRASEAGLPRLIAVSERMAGVFARRHAGPMASALTVSLVGWLGMTAEYWLMAHFLGLALTGWQAIAGMTMALLSFLLPIPAGLGALEASQVLALGAMGFPPAAAVSLTLLIRGRDLFFGGLGLMLAGRRFGVK
jgi:glycosyltransferase 2 family protein